jgi:hypothetical protein
VAGVWLATEALGYPGEDGVVPDVLVEVRMVVLVDCGGRVYWRIRSQGKAPERVVVFEPGTDVGGIDGLCRGLRRLLLAIGANMNTGMIDMVNVALAGAAE